jgi:hypothetical protein
MRLSITIKKNDNTFISMKLCLHGGNILQKLICGFLERIEVHDTDSSMDRKLALMMPPGQQSVRRIRS